MGVWEGCLHLGDLQGLFAFLGVLGGLGGGWGQSDGRCTLLIPYLAWLYFLKDGKHGRAITFGPLDTMTLTFRQ